VTVSLFCCGSASDCVFENGLLEETNTENKKEERKKERRKKKEENFIDISRVLAQNL